MCQACGVAAVELIRFGSVCLPGISVAFLLQRPTLVHRDVVALVALDLVLRFVRSGVICAASITISTSALPFKPDDRK